MRTKQLGWEICARTHDQLGESPLWSQAEIALYWIDYYGPTVHRQKGIGGPVKSWKVSASGTIGSLVFSDRGLLLAMDHGLFLFDPATGLTRPFANPKGTKSGLIYNDSKVDRAGRYWIGTLCLDENATDASFYRLTSDGNAVLADRGFSICNGPAFSPDNRKLYFSDSVGQRILRYDLDPNGVISRRETFFTFSQEEGLPDGLTVDTAGNVWCALYGGSRVVCIDAKGTVVESLSLPASYPTSLCLGGEALTTLFVTTGWNTLEDRERIRDDGGSVFMREVEIPGIPEPVFRPQKF